MSKAKKINESEIDEAMRLSKQTHPAMKARDLIPLRTPKVGRPTVMTGEKIALVLELFEAGHNLLDVAELADISAASILKHAREDEEFSRCYATAREVGSAVRFERLVKEMGNIEDAPDIIKGHAPALANWLRTRVDAIKWCLGKMQPAKYGESSLLKVGNHDGTGPAKIVIEVIGASSADLLGTKPPPMLEAETIPDAEVSDPDSE